MRWLDGPRGCVDPALVHPDRRGDGRDRPDRALGPAARVPRRAALGRTTPSAPRVHVNVSPVELRDRRSSPGSHAALERERARPERLVLEITESVVLREPEKSIATCEQLRDSASGSRSTTSAPDTRRSATALAPDRLAEDRKAVHRQARAGGDRPPFVRMMLDLAASLGPRRSRRGHRVRRSAGIAARAWLRLWPGLLPRPPAELGPDGLAPAPCLGAGQGGLGNWRPEWQTKTLLV